MVLASGSLAAAQPSDEDAVKALLQRFLEALGNNHLDALAAMYVPSACVGWARRRDDAWESATISFADWYAAQKVRTDRTPFHEIVEDWDIRIDLGRLAFVRAVARIERNGRTTSHNFDYFTLVKEGTGWNFLRVAYTATQVAAPQPH